MPVGRNFDWPGEGRGVVQGVCWSAISGPREHRRRVFFRAWFREKLVAQNCISGVLRHRDTKSAKSEGYFSS